MDSNTLKFYKYSPIKKPKYKGKFCYTPFSIVQIDHDGDVLLCSCPADMPYTIGNIYNNSLQEIWLNESAQRVRQAVIDQDFTYCSWNCSSLPNLPDRPLVLPTVPDFPRIVKVDLDKSCNLKCPSCRENSIMEKNSDRINKQIEIFDELKRWALNNPDKHLVIIPLGGGEVFASHSGLKFIQSLQNFPGKNLHLQITTNGTLVYKNKELLMNIKPLLQSFVISLDAATAETYKQVRGGDWDEVMRGMEFLHQTLKLPLTLRFVIQKSNWQEIQQFAELADRFNAKFHYQKLLDWGHWTIDWWHKNNVFDRTGQDFELALDQLEMVKQIYPDQVSMAAELSKYLEKRQQNTP